MLRAVQQWWREVAGVHPSRPPMTTALRINLRIFCGGNTRLFEAMVDLLSDDRVTLREVARRHDIDPGTLSRARERFAAALDAAAEAEGLTREALLTA